MKSIGNCSATLNLTLVSKQTLMVVIFHDTTFEDSGMVRFSTNLGARYAGLEVLFNRNAPIDDQDLVTVKPGESFSTELDLCDLISFPKAATYRVRAHLRLYSFAAGFTGTKTIKRSKKVTISSNVIGVKLAGPSSPRNIDEEKFPIAEKQSAFLQCKAQEADQINAAREIAIAGSKESANVVEESPSTETYLGQPQTELPSDDEIATWAKSSGIYWVEVPEPDSIANNFESLNGDAEKALRSNTDMKSIYNSISKALASRRMRFLCDKPKTQGGKCPSSSVVAFVYPGSIKNKIIHLCGAFWRAPENMQTDSKPGTLIHEASHFYDVGNTKDWVYGTSDVLAVAKEAPILARWNADNVEQFAENLDE